MIDDIEHLGVPDIRAIFLKGNSQNHYLRLRRINSCADHLFQCHICHKNSHMVIDPAPGCHNLAGISKPLCLVNKIVRIYADTVPSDQSRAESQRIPLRVHAIHDLIGIDSHPLKYHCHLIHKCDVDVPLAVFHYLDCLRRLNRGYRKRSCFNNCIIYLPDPVSCFRIHSRYDLPDRFERVNPVARIDSLR